MVLLADFLNVPLALVESISREMTFEARFKFRLEESAEAGVTRLNSPREVASAKTNEKCGQSE